MAQMEKPNGIFFILPQDVILMQNTEEEVSKIAVRNITKLHKKYYNTDLTKETNFANHYGKKEQV